MNFFLGLGLAPHCCCRVFASFSETLRSARARHIERVLLAFRFNKPQNYPSPSLTALALSLMLESRCVGFLFGGAKMIMHLSRAADWYKSEMCEHVGSGQFLTFGGPDSSKIGTDFSVAVACAANSVTGKCGVAFPQVIMFCIVARPRSWCQGGWQKKARDVHRLR